MRSVRPKIVFCLLLSTVTLTMCHPELTNSISSLLIRKCCPAGQQLDSTHQQCIDYRDDNNVPAVSTVNKEFVTTNLSLWWMDAEVKPLSSKAYPDKQLVQSLLTNQDPAKYIEYGVRQPCAYHKTKVIYSQSNDYDILDNGTLIYYSPVGVGRNVTFGPETYCADQVEHDQESKRRYFAYFVCPCESVLCINKCCWDHHMLSVKEKRKAIATTCIYHENNTWRPEFYYDLYNRSVQSPPHMMINFVPQCPHNSSLILANVNTRENYNNFWILQNGSARVENFGRGKAYNGDAYCVDSSALQDEVVPNIMMCVEIRSESSDLSAEAKYYGSLFVIGVVFLTATLGVYWLLPKMRSADARLLMCHSGSLLVTYMVLAVGQFQQTMVPVSCFCLAFVIQWSFLAAFFWLNVMCIDISWAFSGLRSLQGSVHDRDRKKFLYYSLYAWGSPTIISIVTAIMEFSEGIPNTFIKPDFGIRACWFKEKVATLAYFYGPMAALLLSNLLLFIFTAAKIFIVRRDTAILHENGHQDRQRFVLYAKLFLLMGVTWVTEIISWAEGSSTILWYVTDFINLLRAVFIFIIFCCKPKVLTLLRQRLHELMPCWCPNIVVKESKTSGGDSRKISNTTTSGTSRTDISLTQVNVDKTGERRSSYDRVN